MGTRQVVACCVCSLVYLARSFCAFLCVLLGVLLLLGWGLFARGIAFRCEASTTQDEEHNGKVYPH